jgi:hypothetical protein
LVNEDIVTAIFIGFLKQAETSKFCIEKQVPVNQT